MDLVPKDLLIEICAYLSSKDVCQFLQVNRLMYKLFQKEQTLQQLIEIKYRYLIGILTKESYFKWDNNIGDLLKIKAIPNYGDKLRQVGQILIDNHYQYIDNHDGKKNSLNMINMCAKLDQEKDIKEFKDDYCHPNIWIFPGGYNSHQCKNRLSVQGNELHLITASTGTNLSPEDQMRLQKGEVVMQMGYYIGDQMNFSLPVEIFTHVILNY